jgi:hypothetical protein
MARANHSILKQTLRLAGAAFLVLALGACRWTSGAALLTKDQTDWSPLKPGAYVHGDETYELKGERDGPIVVTTKAENDAQTYDITFQKLGGKFYLVQAVNGTEVNYLLIRTNKEGFIQFRPGCKDEDRAIATAAGATVDANEDCQFATLESLRKAAKDSAETIAAGGTGFAGDAFIRKR